MKDARIERMEQLEKDIINHKTDIQVIDRSIELLLEKKKSIEWFLTNDREILNDLREGKGGCY